MVSRNTRLGLEFMQKTLEEKINIIRDEFNKLTETVNMQKTDPRDYGINLIKSVEPHKGTLVWRSFNTIINDMNISCYKTNEVLLVYTLKSDLFIPQNTYVIYYTRGNKPWKKIPIRCKSRGVLIINKDPGIAFDFITIFKLPNTTEAIDVWTSDDSTVESRREFLHMCGEPLKLTEKNFAAY